MEPTASKSSSRPGQVEFAFEKGDVPTTSAGKDGQLAPGTEKDVAGNPDSLAAGSTQAPADVPPGHSRVMARRTHVLERVIYVLICLQLGLMLVVLPWKEVWDSNALLAGYPNVRAVLQSYFVRGLVTGLGVVDLWLGISEAARRREPEAK